MWLPLATLQYTLRNGTMTHCQLLTKLLSFPPVSVGFSLDLRLVILITAEWIFIKFDIGEFY
jgi:hypothetical protein